MTTKATKKVHAFNFKGEGAHVALVDKAANLQEVLTMKAAEPEVLVSLTMKDFLKKMFGMWEEDAATLAGMLGYKSDVYDDYKNEDGTYMSDQEYISNKIDTVQLLKGQDLDKIPESISLKVEELIKEFGDQLNSSKGSPEEEAKTSKLNGESNMDDVQIKKTELEALKAQAKEVESFKAQLKEVEALKAQLEEMKSEKAAKAKADLTDVVKGYSFISEGDQEPMVDFLLKAEGSDVFLASLEKARVAIAAAAMEETGVEGGDAEVDVEKSSVDLATDLVSDILKARKA